MADVNVTIGEVEPIHIIVKEEQPIQIVLGEGAPSLLDSIFVPDEDGNRIVKLYVKNGKLKVKYEGGE